jgi:hypothetical protein
MPERIQLRRTKGWRKPEGAIVVSRPSKWGNPWKVGEDALITWPYYHNVPPVQRVRQVPMTPGLAVELYRIAFTPDADAICDELRGHDLACWCPLDQPCHADVLLEIANA